MWLNIQPVIKKAYEKLAAERLKRVRGMTKQEMLKDPEYQNNINKYFDALMNEYNE